MGGKPPAARQDVADQARQPARQEPPKGGDKEKADDLRRKITYTANLDLIVEDLDTARQELEKAVEEGKGYIARSEVRGTPGSPPNRTWPIPFPAPTSHSFPKPT